MNKLNKTLLQNEIDDYKERGIEVFPIKYNKSIFEDLFEKYNYYGMEEISYCCHRLEKSCWVEFVEENIWNYTLDMVKTDILSEVHMCRKYLYNEKRYGKNRLLIGEKDGISYVYIYTRDLIGVDYAIWFANK